MKKIKRGSIVKVSWIDAHTAIEGWMDEDAASEFVADDCPVTTVGFFQGRAKGQMTICATKMDTGQVCSCINIPVGCIKKIEVL